LFEALETDHLTDCLRLEEKRGHLVRAVVLGPNWWLTVRAKLHFDQFGMFANWPNFTQYQTFSFRAASCSMTGFGHRCLGGFGGFKSISLTVRLSHE
jgi:hypothetical protein